jgi:hypothetical protein
MIKSEKKRARDWGREAKTGEREGDKARGREWKREMQIEILRQEERERERRRRLRLRLREGDRE